MSTIQRAYKTELDLNNEQTTVCRKHAGAARWAYNWGLARKQETYRQTGKSPSAMDLHRELNALKQTAVPGCTRSPSVRRRKPCVTWTAPSPTFFAAPSSRRRGSTEASSAIPGARARNAVWAASASPAQLWCAPTPSSCRAWGGCGCKSARICPLMPKSSQPLSRSRRGTGTSRCWWSRSRWCLRTAGRSWGWTWASSSWLPCRTARPNPTRAP